MKKINLLLSVLMMALFAFTSCDNGDEPPLVIIEDGTYVFGEATSSTELAAKLKMAAGINEADDQTLRSGMYEKYIALKGGKDFSLLLYTAGQETYYGATLAYDSLGGDSEPNTDAWSGDLIIGKDAPKMQVPEDGLYHIVLDLNIQEDLPSAMIVVAKAELGVRGEMNGWGFTAMEAPAFNQETMTYTWTGDVGGSGQFKFAYGGGWKIELDERGNVKANTNLGSDAVEDGGEYTGLKAGGKNFPIAKGAYEISLTWSLRGGALGNGFETTITKTADLPNTDWSAVKWDAVGGGISADNTAATTDTHWGWGQMLWADNGGIPSKDGEVYTYTWSNVVLEADGFKVRQFNDDGGIASDKGYSIVDATNSSANIIDDGGNIKCTVKGTYTMTLVIDAVNDDAMTLTIVE